MSVSAEKETGVEEIEKQIDQNQDEGFLTI